MSEFTRFRSRSVFARGFRATLQASEDRQLLAAQENVAKEKEDTQDPDQRADLAMLARKKFQEGERKEPQA